MSESKTRGILLDIEGTTSSISFVYEKMFPFVREKVAEFLNQNWEVSDVQDCLPLLAIDLGHESLGDWLAPSDSVETAQEKVVVGVAELMDGDVKATGLKQLQGLIWKDGFHSGQLVAHLFADVAPAIQQWNSDGMDVRIYSSGSIGAQKLFFGHSVAGNLLDQFQGHYDTTTGGKKEAESYRLIAADFGLPANEITFVSDVVDELSAAQAAGLQTVLSVRPGNKPQPEGHNFPIIRSFDQIELSGSKTA